MNRKDLADLLSRAAAFCEDTDSLDHEDRTALVEDLLEAEQELRPDEPFVPSEAERDQWVEVRFKPEAWINDYATPVDPETPDTWFVEKDQVPAEGASPYDWDELRDHANAPQWVKDWSGPFEVELA